LIEDHLGQLDQQIAGLLAERHDAVQRLAEVLGLSADSAQQIMWKSVPPRRFPSPNTSPAG
jgi:hypothetical protein